MNVISYSSPDLFLQYTEAFLSQSVDLEITNNLLIGVTRAVQRGVYQNSCMFSVMDEKGNIALAANMTPPYNLVLSVGEKTALSPLIDFILENKITIPGVIAEADIANAFTTFWKEKTGQSIEPDHRMTLYALTAVQSPASSIAGTFRQAVKEDIDWITDWIMQFALDANLPEHERKRDPDGTKRKIENRLLYVWENETLPVSIAGYNPSTENGVRIGPVYTPADKRGKGYASACVTTLTQKLLDDGKEWCSLFADVENLSSNAIYQKIGYKEHCSYLVYRFT